MKINLAIVDDKSQNIILVSEKLKSADNIAIAFTAANGAEFLDKMKALQPMQQPNVVLMDIEMPVMNGIETVHIGKQLYPAVKFLMLTVFDNDDKIFEAIKSGADGYLLKDEKVSVIIDCIQQVSETGSAPMSPRIARKALDLLRRASIENYQNKTSSFKPEAYLLSERETEVLHLLVDGYNYRTIAEKLFVSANTIRKHIANIYEKLHVSSKAQAIKIATKDKLI